ncbi:MAG: hydantoinase/oxoprolinase family protein [Rhizobiales bacterium]|nr:hydantoinase/oxoprolinase family protein [Hyphomicrobiales bacterium]
MAWIGIDVGGTFTDAVASDPHSGQLIWAKSATTPDHPQQGVLNAIAKLEVELSAVNRLVHGLTLGTNAILERKGADVWVVTTKGFRDTLEIARTNRTILYDINTLKPPSLVPRQHILEVSERLAYDGSVLSPLDEAELDSVADKLIAAKARTVAVCFLHSYVNSAHETQAAAYLRQRLPGSYVCTSSEVLPEYREYERFSTTVLNAYIGPKVSSYLAELKGDLGKSGYAHEVLITTSSGGVATAERAARFPISTVLSGPAGGVAAAVHLGRQIGIPNLITYDMGGTSTDVCLVENLEVPLTSEQFISELPNRTSQIEINTVGAGGGSIAWIDDGPILRVGPQSASSQPGPACYGRGGVEPTVTDANLMLGRLDAEGRLAGEVSLDRSASERALKKLQPALGDIELIRLADGVIKIAVARMVSAIKEISIGRGYDPRDFALLAYGGAGPLHAAFIAEELDMHTVLVPPGPGNFSALGAILSDIRYDYVRTQLLDTRKTSVEEIDRLFEPLEGQGKDELLRDGVPGKDIVLQRSLGMRYIGQSWELDVAIPADVKSVEEMEALFYRLHEIRYGHATKDPTEIVSLRVAAIGRVNKPELPELAANSTSKPKSVRKAFFDGEVHDVDVYEREHLPLTKPLSGPLIIEEGGSVTIVPPGWSCRVGKVGTLVLKKESA